MKNLRKRREQRGCPGGPLDQVRGVPPDDLGHRAEGHPPQVDTAMKLAKALGTTVSDLIGEKASA